MSSPNSVDPLAGLYVDEEEAQPQVQEQPTQAPKDDPLAGLYVSETGEYEEQPYRDPVSENMRAQGYEPDFSEELERAAAYGTLEAWKGVLSGATFGLSEKIPGFKGGNNAATKTGEVLGSFAPITGLINVYGKGLGYVAKASPYFKKSLEFLTGITSMGLAGGTYGGIKHTVEKGELPSTNEVLKHGFEWAALDGVLRAAGALGSFAVNVTKAARKTGQPEFKVVNDVYTELRNQGVDIATDKRAGAKALSIIEDMVEGKPKAQRTRVREVNQKKISQMDEAVESLSEPILPEAMEESVNVNNIIEASEQKAVRSRIDSVGRRAVEDAELGQEVQQGVNRAREQAKEQYKPFYTEVENGSRFITTTPKETAKKAGDLITALEELRTRPTGYATVLRTLEDALRDAGYVIQRSESGVIENIIQKGEVGVDRLTELGRRLGEIVEYDVLDFTVKDRLKPIVKAVKNDIRAALEKANPDLLAAFNLAEESFAINAKKFGRDSIRKIRSTEALEVIPKQLESATALKDLAEVVSPTTMKNVERQVLEKMNQMTEGKARDFLRKVRSGLSKDSQAIAEEIIASKRPINKQSIQSRRERLHEVIDEDLASSMNTGKRPAKTLELWQNPRGQKLVKQALETNPQKKQLIDYLQKQTLQDMAKSILKSDGTIDPAKLKSLMDNPAIRNNIRELGGQEAVQFFEQLGKRSQNLKKNVKQLGAEQIGKVSESTKERGKYLLNRMATKDFPFAKKIDAVLSEAGLGTKVTLSVFGAMKLGFPNAIMLGLGKKLFWKYATSNKMRDAFREISKSQINTKDFFIALEAINQAFDEED